MSPDNVVECEVIEADDAGVACWATIDTTRVRTRLDRGLFDGLPVYPSAEFAYNVESGVVTALRRDNAALAEDLGSLNREWESSEENQPIAPRGAITQEDSYGDCGRGAGEENG